MSIFIHVASKIVCAMLKSIYTIGNFMCDMPNFVIVMRRFICHTLQLLCAMFNFICNMGPDPFMLHLFP